MPVFNIIRLINEFNACNPNYEMIVEELDEDRVLFLLQSGGCDVAFCSNIKLSEKNYIILKVCHEDFSVSFAKSHELAGKTEIKLAELKGQKVRFQQAGIDAVRSLLQRLRCGGIHTQRHYADLKA